MKVEIKELSPDLWPDLERLFGPEGACAGCWCMYWRLSGEEWNAIKGEGARRRFKDLVTTGKAHGILAYCDGEPVGWAAFDARPDFARLNRSPALKCQDADRVWSIPCFFVKRGYRGKGVARRLLEHAVRSLRKRGAAVVEGYPVKPREDGRPVPAAFAWTGLLPMFERAGFTVVAAKERGMQRARKQLRSLT